MRDASDVQKELCCAFQGLLKPEVTDDDSDQHLSVMSHPCSTMSTNIDKFQLLSVEREEASHRKEGPEVAS